MLISILYVYQLLLLLIYHRLKPLVLTWIYTSIKHNMVFDGPIRLKLVFKIGSSQNFYFLIYLANSYSHLYFQNLIQKIILT